MTKEEILKSYNITPETKHHVYDKYLYPKIVKCMEEYGQLMYNQALEAAAAHVEADLIIISNVAKADMYGLEAGLDYEIGINRGSILKLKKI